MEYKNYSSQLEKLKAEQSVKLEANKQICEKVEYIKNLYQDFSNPLAEAHNININTLLNIDTNKLATDTEYVEEVKKLLEIEINKIIDVLGGILN